MTSVNDALPSAPPIALMLAGRTFRQSVSTTMAQDAYVMKRQLAFSSLGAPADDPFAAGQSLIMTAFESGLMYEVLGGLLVEDDVPWSQATATENARFFAALTAREDKNVLWENIAGILSDFLVGAGEWSRASLRSSVANLDGGRPSNPSGELVSTTMESGTTSSASLPVTT